MVIKETHFQYSKENVVGYLAKITHMLTNTDLQVNEIFEAMGTTNTPYIREAFKAKFGTTFAAYRERLKNRGVPVPTPYIKPPTRARRKIRSQDEIEYDAKRIAHLLGTTRLSIGQIHERLDVPDTDPSRHTFNAHYGLNYSEYRRAVVIGKIAPEKTPDKELTMNTTNDPGYSIKNVIEVADLLINTDAPIKEILAKFEIVDQPRFYTGFRRHFGCTPTEYRNAEGNLSAITSTGNSSTVANQEFDFTLTVRQVVNHPGAIPGGYDLSTVLQIPFLVNDRYEYRAQIVTISGVCPFSDPCEFLKSKYRDKFNDLVVKTVAPFYHGQLNIAYMQKTTAHPQGPGSWSSPARNQPGFGQHSGM